MLQLFLDTVPATLADIKSATEKSEWMLLSKYAHKLKSTIDSMNISTVKDVIRAIESKGKKGEDVVAIPALVEKVLAVMKEVIEQVKKEI